MEIEKRERTTAAEARGKNYEKDQGRCHEKMTYSKFGSSLIDLFINILISFSRLFWRSLHGKMDKNRTWASSTQCNIS